MLAADPRRARARSRTGRVRPSRLPGWPGPSGPGSYLARRSLQRSLHPASRGTRTGATNSAWTTSGTRRSASPQWRPSRPRVRPAGRPGRAARADHREPRQPRARRHQPPRAAPRRDRRRDPAVRAPPAARRPRPPHPAPRGGYRPRSGVLMDHPDQASRRPAPRGQDRRHQRPARLRPGLAHHRSSRTATSGPPGRVRRRSTTSSTGPPGSTGLGRRGPAAAGTPPRRTGSGSGSPCTFTADESIDPRPPAE
jgi:hypothetical protein